MPTTLRKLQDAAILEANVPASVATALDKWALWMQGGTGARGYPSKACGMGSGGIHTSDDIHEQNDSYAAKACDGAIMSLNPGQIAGIGVYWLGNHHREVLPGVLREIVVSALPIVYRGLIVRGCA